jgi:predicted transcriptional regulator
MEPTFVKRGRLEIIYAILSICHKPVNKTSILYKCNLSFSQLQKYMEYLFSHNLLRSIQEKQRDYYHVTDKGKTYIEEYEKLTGLLKEEKDNSTVTRTINRNGHIIEP